MQNSFNGLFLKDLFPTKEVKENKPNQTPFVKVHVDSLNKKELESLFWGVPDSVDINIKRSGTGMTIILTNK